MLTDERTARLSAIGERLEQQYHRHTLALTALTARARHGADATRVTVRIVDRRQALADTARALQRLAEGSYGTCQTCHQDIAITQLECRPQVSQCVRCQRERPC